MPTLINNHRWCGEKLVQLGICLEKGGLHYAAVQNNKGAFSLVKREKLVNPEDRSETGSAEWYFDTFTGLVNEHDAQKIACKIHYAIKNQEGLKTHGFPLGILSLVAHNRSVDLSFFTKQKLKGPKLFGLAKHQDPFTWVEQYKDKLPYWNDAAKTAVLLAIAAGAE